MKYVLIVILFSFSCIRAVSAESIVVVASIPNSSLKPSLQEIRNLFMGGVLSYDLIPIALPSGSQTRVLFNTKVIGLTEARIQSYWAQMRFSGRKKQPIELDNEMSVIDYLQSHPGSIAYLSVNREIPSDLTVILLVE